jgi:hypothetical protein
MVVRPCRLLSRAARPHRRWTTNSSPTSREPGYASPTCLRSFSGRTTPDGDQPTTAVGDVDQTAVAGASPRTVAAEQYSEPPTTVVPDAGLTQAPELAWSSSDADDETIAFDGRSWQAAWGRVAIIAACAAVAIVLVVLVGIDAHRHRGGEPATTPLPDTSVGDGSTPAGIWQDAPPQQWKPFLPPAPPLPPPAQSNITAQQANTICGWLRDPAWTMPQIESSTGDMLADDNPSFKGTPDVFKAITAAMSSTCPDAANQRPF